MMPAALALFLAACKSPQETEVQYNLEDLESPKRLCEILVEEAVVAGQAWCANQKNGDGPEETCLNKDLIDDENRLLDRQASYLNELEPGGKGVTIYINLRRDHDTLFFGGDPRLNAKFNGHGEVLTGFWTITPGDKTEKLEKWAEDQVMLSWLGLWYMPLGFSSMEPFPENEALLVGAAVSQNITNHFGEPYEFTYLVNDFFDSDVIEPEDRYFEPFFFANSSLIPQVINDEVVIENRLGVFHNSFIWYEHWESDGNLRLKPVIEDIKSTGASLISLSNLVVDPDLDESEWDVIYCAPREEPKT